MSDGRLLKIAAEALRQEWAGMDRFVSPILATDETNPDGDKVIDAYRVSAGAWLMLQARVRHVIEAVGESGGPRFKYTAVSAPRFADAERTMINCLVLFPALSPAPLEYTAAAVDPGAPHSEEIFKRCLAGEFGPVAPFEEVQPIAEEQ